MLIKGEQNQYKFTNHPALRQITARLLNKVFVVHSACIYIGIEF